MTVNEVRARYLAFFKKRGHAIIPSASIVPENDPTTLFTSSGMQPLVPYLLGAQHPLGNRLANSQLCFRAEDIDEVGDNRHTTFFEMLGNWSLGDYFKEEQLPWFYEFLTNKEEGLGLDPEKLSVTVFGGDELSGMTPDTDSREIWKNIDIPNERIFSYGANKNWWSRAGEPSKMPVGEIGGPDSEVFYDFAIPHDPDFGDKCHVNCDCGRYLEIGNSVFMQFIKKENGGFDELPQKNVDFGGGLERLAAAVNGDPDIFMTDVFDAARAVLESRSDKCYADTKCRQKNDACRHLVSAGRSFRIVLDHVRAASFMIASGIKPGNTEQGYVLRRLIRRAIRETDKLGIKNAVLAEVAEGFGDAYAEVYPFVKDQTNTIREALEKEETQFKKTLEKGLKILEKMFGIGTFGLNYQNKPDLNEVDSVQVFDLYQTYGFPLELIQEELAQRNLFVDEKKFKELMQKHQAKSRAGATQKFKGGLTDANEMTTKLHTAHHLLLKALQKVLGPDVHQRGSNITNERLRIDFSYEQKMTPEQIAEVEKIVNKKIAEKIPVVSEIMKKENAEKIGAEHEFRTTYPEMVSVYTIGDSIEFCGGPHAKNTGDLGYFKILKEEASSAGIRRIKAMLK